MSLQLDFQDQYPREIEFEIDRMKLLGYLSDQAKLGCFGIVFPFAILIAFAFYREAMAPFHKNDDIWFWFGWFSLYMLGGLAACGVLGSVLYVSYFRRSARLKANNLRLMVDGCYLRLVSGGFVVIDQRFHFREVSSYATVQGPLLRRHKLKTLCFRIDRRMNSPALLVTGLADADEVRDVLCEIDAAREWAGSSSPGHSRSPSNG
ncbi:hypothetical protein [Rhodopirellula sp. MGV]|uniref:hypothetical protein n=1 Tax=Rhodopirellula sp. MGV TaxID=2023130 RepID=UPI00117A5172|nr:hypothetical protein [Rhodopirellula sp. MGV]